MHYPQFHEHRALLDIVFSCSLLLIMLATSIPQMCCSWECGKHWERWLHTFFCLVGCLFTLTLVVCVLHCLKTHWHTCRTLQNRNPMFREGVNVTSELFLFPPPTHTSPLLSNLLKHQGQPPRNTSKHSQTFCKLFRALYWSQSLQRDCCGFDDRIRQKTTPFRRRWLVMRFPFGTLLFFLAVATFKLNTLVINIHALTFCTPKGIFNAHFNM